MELSTRSPLLVKDSRANAALFALLAALAGAAAALLSGADPRVAAAIALAVPFAYTLWLAWDRPRIGLYLLVATAALDTAGRITPRSGIPITIYQVVLVVVALAVARDVWRGRAAARAPGAPLPLAASMRTSRSTALDVPMLAFLAVVGLSIGMAPDAKKALLDTITLGSAALLFFLCVYLVDDVRQARNLIITLLVTAALLAPLALLERFTGFSILGRVLESYQAGVRIRGTFNDPNIFAAYLMTAAAFSAPLVLQARERWLKWGGIAGLGVVGGALFLTFSRGAWLGAAVAALVVLVLSRMDARTKIAILLAVALAVPAVIAVVPQRFMEEKLAGLSSDPSAQGRIVMAESALRIVRDHPWGVGTGNYSEVYPQYRLGAVRASLIESHTAYLTLLVEVGFFGLALFLWMLAAFASRVAGALPSIRDPLTHAVLLGCLAAFAAVSTQAFFYSLESFKLWWLAMGLGMATLRVWRVAGGPRARMGAGPRPTEKGRMARQVNGGSDGD